jgi:hypothetical protein
VLSTDAFQPHPPFQASWWSFGCFSLGQYGLAWFFHKVRASWSSVLWHLSSRLHGLVFERQLGRLLVGFETQANLFFKTAMDGKWDWLFHAFSFAVVGVELALCIENGCLWVFSFTRFSGRSLTIFKVAVWNLASVGWRRRLSVGSVLYRMGALLRVFSYVQPYVQLKVHRF